MQDNALPAMKKEASVTTSVRLNPELRRKLDRYAKRNHVGRDRVIGDALRHYLGGVETAELASEARRQSILASGQGADGLAWNNAAEGDPWPRKRNLLPEFEALMARKAGNDVLDDLAAVRGG